MCISFGNPSDPCCEDAPAVPSTGGISRYLRPESIADYAGLSDAEWIAGTTGTPGPDADCFCFYHHFQASRQTGVFNVLNPIRWSPMAPEHDGGRFDCWRYTGGDQFRANPHSNGFVGLRRGLIPKDWHCRFIGGVALPWSPPLPSFCTRGTPGSDTEYQETNLQAIAPTIPPFEDADTDKLFTVEVSVAAICHYINGNQVRGVVFGDALDNVENWRVRVRPDDFYQIDVWYRVGYNGVPSGSADIAKGCAVIRTARVESGSELVPTYRKFNEGFYNDGVLPHFMNFLNVDFSPFFNSEKQTFEITLSGHRGWSLAYGSNGPHKLLNPLPGELIGQGELTVAVGSTSIICEVENDSPVERIFVLWAFEIAFAIITFKHGTAPVRSALYRSSDTSGGHYLTETQTTDFGTIRHAPPGRFNQAGTTVFALVPWSLNPNLNEAFEYYGKQSEGTTGPDPAIPSSVPRRIIVNRVSL